jgi:hypothetical protein
VVGQFLYLWEEYMNVWNVLEGGWTRRTGDSNTFFYHFSRLAAVGGGIRAEIRPVLRRYARLAWTATWVSLENTCFGQKFRVRVKCAAWWYILKRLARDGLPRGPGVGDNLGKLPPGEVIARPKCAIRIAVDNTETGKAAHIWIEGAARRHICELYRARRR